MDRESEGESGVLVRLRQFLTGESLAGDMEHSARSADDAGGPNVRLTAIGALVVLVSVLFAGLAGFEGDIVAALGVVPVAVAGILLVGIGSRPGASAE